MAILENTKPIRIKAARGVSAKLWKNHNKHGEWYIVTISRVYKDDVGEFQDSDSFSRDDLLQVAFVAQKAFDRIVSESKEPEDD